MELLLNNYLYIIFMRIGGIKKVIGYESIKNLVAFGDNIQKLCSSKVAVFSALLGNT